MPMADFMELERMQTHEELLASGKVFEWDEDCFMDINFCSHQSTELPESIFDVQQLSLIHI